MQNITLDYYFYGSPGRPFVYFSNLLSVLKFIAPQIQLYYQYIT